MAKYLIAPSIISCDFTELGSECKKIEEAGADMLHVDIMDGHFVPNLTIGFDILAAISRSTKLFLDVHIMVYNPYDLIKRLAENGADGVTFHVEATENVEEVISFIRTCGLGVGLAISPETSLSLVERYLPLIDKLLVMTVHPGFGGQSIVQESFERVEEAKSLIEARGLCIGSSLLNKGKKGVIDLQVDGGVNFENAPLLAKAGANNFVAGHLLFAKDGLPLSDRIIKLRESLESL